MSNYNILFLDIDGTILKSDHTIDPSTKDAIQQVKEKGIEVFLATGRPLHELANISKELDVHSFIGYNGAYAVYKDEEIINEPMNPDTVDFYLDVAKKHNHDMVLYTSNANTFTSLENKSVKVFSDIFNLQKNTLFNSDVRADILGITLINIGEGAYKLYHKPEEDIYFSQVNVPNLKDSYDVIRENVNKGRAIKHILDMLQLSPDRAIAFGDGMNDKQMLQYVGESFAMGNANPELFSYAKRTTTSVDDDGIFNGLKTLGLVE
ncbi:HAD family hydrolase [Aquibacillus sediminis]|uniref:HAD family hydrolase n=1 Tax=Aquibacillus sediminis TaxID=2574734 RepID=UPI001107C599|nr:HAD family hydrolase [Aquibacillus sediminis]